MTRCVFDVGKHILIVLLMVASGALVGATAAELTFDIKVEHGRVAEAARLIRVKQGDVVKLHVTSDRPLVVHLHGYDIEKRVTPGAATELAFTAHATGRFPLHVHGEAGGAHGHDDEALVNVEVYPR